MCLIRETKMGNFLSNNLKIGYTTGVFDLFHVGHLRILQQAKEKCDFLIVGVSSDELVESYKRKTPIIPLSDRMEIVSAIDCVDKVVVQAHRDKVLAHKEVGFDVMFVGDDWKGKPVFQEAEAQLNKVNVEIVYFPYTKHVSSTRLTKVLESLDDIDDAQ